MASEVILYDHEDLVVVAGDNDVIEIRLRSKDTGNTVAIIPIGDQVGQALSEILADKVRSIRSRHQDPFAAPIAKAHRTEDHS